MKRKARAVLSALAGLTLLIACLSLTAVLILRTAWFENFVRTRSIASMQQATGGKVDLDAFTFHWSTLTAEFTGLTIHGTEPASAPPLLHVPSLRVTFTLTALLHGSAAVQSLDVLQPRVNLIIAADGATNLPPVRGAFRSPADLLSYRVRRFVVTNGFVNAANLHLPLNVQGSDVNLLVRYLPRPRRYALRLSSNDVQIQGGGQRIELLLQAELQRDNVLLKQMALHSDASAVRLSGSITHLSAPIVILHASGAVAVGDLSRFTRNAQLEKGVLTFSGLLNYSLAKDFTFAADVSGTEIACRFPQATFAHVSVHSAIDGDKNGIRFHDLLLKSGRTSLRGEASLEQWRSFLLGANIRDLDLDRITAFGLTKGPHWDSLLSGSVRVRLPNIQRQGDLSAAAHLQLAALPGPNPLTGELAGSYNASTQQVDIESAALKTNASTLSLTGTPRDLLSVHFQTSNASELQPLLGALPHQPALLAQLDLANSSIQFDGTIFDLIHTPQVIGDLAWHNVRMPQGMLDALEIHVSATASHIDFSKATVTQQGLQITGSGSADLVHWEPAANSAITFIGSFKGVNLRETAARYAQINLPIINGVAAGSAHIGGTLLRPQGSLQLSVDNLDIYGQRLNRAQAHLTSEGDVVRIEQGRLNANSAVLTFEGGYRHGLSDWRTGSLQFHVDSNGFPLESLSSAQRFFPGVAGRMEIHTNADLRVLPHTVEAASIDGRVSISDLALARTRYGSLALRLSTQNGIVSSSISGTLSQSQILGYAKVTLTSGLPFTADLAGSHLDMRTFQSLLPLPQKALDQVSVSFDGKLSLAGVLTESKSLHGHLDITNLEAAPSAAATGFHDLVFHSGQVFGIEFANGIARVENLRLSTRQGSLAVEGTFGYIGKVTLALKVKGDVSLDAFELLDPNVISDGKTSLDAQIQGALDKPLVDGTLQVSNGNIHLREVATGLTNVNGTIRFNRTLATIQSLSAESGGGHLDLLGFINFGTAGQLSYNLTGIANMVRFRYANSVSVTGNAHLQLTGTTVSGLISGDVVVSRVFVNADTDIGGILALTAAHSQSSGADTLITGLQMDVHISSSPDLQVGATLSRDLEADIDMRLRGSVNRPLLFGAILANQGEIRVFGAKYTINRGEITFANTSRIEPIVDLDLQTTTRGVTVDITVTGTLSKLNMNYRSDPPLQSRDIIALLTVGQTPGFAPNLPSSPSSANDINALQAGANSLLGQSGAPGSARMSKLFGITNIKIDPLVQGVANTPQARLTIEQQISQNVTVTYVTNLAQTSEQIFRFEYALNPRFSVIAVRDDNGEFGIDFLYKRRFK